MPMAREQTWELRLSSGKSGRRLCMGEGRTKPPEDPMAQRSGCAPRPTRRGESARSPIGSPLHGTSGARGGRASPSARRMPSRRAWAVSRRVSVFYSASEAATYSAPGRTGSGRRCLPSCPLCRYPMRARRPGCSTALRKVRRRVSRSRGGEPRRHHKSRDAARGRDRG